MRKVIQKLFLSCRKATELVEKKQLAGLSCKENLQLTTHKLMCYACRNYQKQSYFIDLILKNQEKNPSNPEPPKPDLKIKIKKSLHSK